MLPTTHLMMMDKLSWTLIYPILIVVFSNVLYNICAKSTSSEANMFAAISITYIVAAIVSFFGVLITTKGKNLTAEYGKINWTSFVLGCVIVVLEFGHILAYRNGWKMNTVTVVSNISLAVALIFIAFLLYKEPITVKKIIGIAFCGCGLVLIIL